MEMYVFNFSLKSSLLVCSSEKESCLETFKELLLTAFPVT